MSARFGSPKESNSHKYRPNSNFQQSASPFIVDEAPGVKRLRTQQCKEFHSPLSKDQFSGNTPNKPLIHTSTEKMEGSSFHSINYKQHKVNRDHRERESPFLETSDSDQDQLDQQDESDQSEEQIEQETDDEVIEIIQDESEQSQPEQDEPEESEQVEESGESPQETNEESEEPEQEIDERSEDVIEISQNKLEESEEQLESDANENSDVNEDIDIVRLKQGQEYLQKLNCLQDGDQGTMDAKSISERLYADANLARGRLTFSKAAQQLYHVDPDDIVIRYLRGHQLPVTAAVISDNEQIVYSAGKDCTIIKWHLPTWKRLTHYIGYRSKKTGKPSDRVPPFLEATTEFDPKSTNPNENNHTHHILTLALTSDGKFLASGGRDKSIKMWNVNEDKLIETFYGHKDTISSLAFRNGKHDLYSASLDRTVKLWNCDNLVVMDTLYGHRDQIFAIDTLTQERCLTASQDKTISLWKIPEQVSLGFASVSSSIECVAFLSENQFVSGCQNGSIQLWSTRKRKFLYQMVCAHGTGSSALPNWITALAGFKYSNLFASGSTTGEIKLWEVLESQVSFRLIFSIQIKGIINSLQFSNSGTKLIAAIGQEPRFGRLFINKQAKNRVAVIELPIRR